MVASVMEFPHDVYLIWKHKSYYVGTSSNAYKRLEQHQKEDPDAVLLDSFKVPTRREAEGIEATLHQIQKQGGNMEDWFDASIFPLHTLWFNSSCKGFPKHLKQKPYPRF